MSHRCTGPHCAVQIADLQQATARFVNQMAHNAVYSQLGAYASPKAGGRIANILEIEEYTPLHNTAKTIWYVMFKRELYWFFGRVNKHEEWGIGVSVPIDMLAAAKWRGAWIAVVHDVDMAYGMRAWDWYAWAQKHRTLDWEQKPDPSAGVPVSEMRRLF